MVATDKSVGAARQKSMFSETRERQRNNVKELPEKYVHHEKPG